jgi:membrane associated rhomboid family serine protease
MDNPESNERYIPVRSHRQAMDWSLVLLSQDIDCTILHDELGWRLQIQPDQRSRAVAVIGQYRHENRGWGWRDRLSEAGADIHWGVLFWCLLLALMHEWIATRGSAWRVAGQMDGAAVRLGQWWRLFTAVSLHADLAHLMANLTAGFLTLGLAMTRWGAAWALLAAGFAGAFGNLCSLVVHPGPHLGLGASGMVMGGLGLLTVPEAYRWRDRKRRLWVLFRSALGGALLFTLLGLNPTSDVVAHAGGYLAGVAFGLALSAVPSSVLQHPSANRLGGLLGMLFFALCWLLALK